MGITHFCLQNTYVEGQWGPALPQVVFGVAGMTTSGLILMMQYDVGFVLGILGVVRVHGYYTFLSAEYVR